MTRAQTLAWKVRRHILVSGDAGALRRLLGGAAPARAEVVALLDELRRSVRLRRALMTPAAQRWLASRGIDGDPLDALLALGGTGRGRALLLYGTIRVTRPRVVVETGCFTGWDSAVILEALERNGDGRLFTIDLPAREGRFSQLEDRPSGLLPGLEPGFLVPDELHDRWDLRLANVKDALPPLLDELGSVDLFFHDSHHSYTHMMWELTTVWPYLAPGAIVVADDISWNKSVADFARSIGSSLIVHRRTPNVGALRIPSVEGAADERFTSVTEAVSR